MADHLLRGMHFPTWIRLLRQHNVEWRYVWRIMDITMTSLACWPMDIIEKAVTRRTSHSISVEQPVFIIGHWRSGTTYLQQLLWSSGDFGCVSMFHCAAAGRFIAFGPLWRRVLSVLFPSGRAQDNVHLEIDGPAEEESAMARISDQAFDHCYHFPGDAKQIITRSVLFEDGKSSKSEWMHIYAGFIESVTLELSGRRLLLKSPANTARISTLARMYPDARFIHIYRNPYEVFYSTRKMWQTLIAQQSFQDVDAESIDEVIFWTYRQLMQRYQADAGHLAPDRLMEISYEQLLDSPLETLRELGHWLGSSWSAETEAGIRNFLEETAGYSRNSFQFDDDVLQRIEKEWGTFIEHYGYSRP